MYQKFFKRSIDLLFSIILLPLILLILFICCILIKIDDKGPIFYNANRLSKNALIFKMFKLRTMRVNSPDIRTADGSTWNSDDDPRVTKIGKLLRKTSLDELPQILNVLKGEMSFIGPRPDTVDSYKTYSKEECKRLMVLPGITGYSQAYYRNSIDAKEKIINDIYYVNNVSLLLDVKILFQTIVLILMRSNVYTIDSHPAILKNEKEINRGL